MTWYAVFRDIVKDAVSALDYLFPGRWADPRSLGSCIETSDERRIEISKNLNINIIWTNSDCTDSPFGWHRLGIAVLALFFVTFLVMVDSILQSLRFSYIILFFSWYIHEIIQKLISRFFKLLSTGSFDMDLWSRFPLLMPIDKIFQVFGLNGILVASLNY